jgi:hypothetical protein
MSKAKPKTPKFLPCPFCGDAPIVDTLGTYIDVYCCVNMTRSKSDFLTQKENRTWVNERYLYAPSAERKALAAVAKEWNTRTQVKTK